MKRVTVVCCYNDMEKFNNLVETIEQQDEKCEVIGIDNCDQKFSACSRAFNSVVDSVVTKFVIFSHQDIVLIERNTIKQFVDYIENMDSNSIMGVAGVQNGSIHHTITNIKLWGKCMFVMLICCIFQRER